MKKKLSLAMFVLMSLNVLAQTEIFKVLVNKGRNTADHKPIFAGSKIYEGQTIQVVSGGYLAMIYKNGRSMELKTPGTFKTSELEKQALASSGTFSQKYAQLVLNEMTKTKENLAEDRKKNMKVAGAVDRGSDGIVVLSPKNSDLLSSTFKLRWLKDKSVKGGYTIKIKNMFDEVLKTLNTPDTMLTINTAELDFSNKSAEKEFIVVVLPKDKIEVGEESSGKLIKLVQGAKAEELQKEIKMIREETGGESALSKILLASFCEQHNLFIEAVDYYEQAIKQEPDIQEFKVAYSRFLERTGLISSKK